MYKLLKTLFILLISVSNSYGMTWSDLDSVRTVKLVKSLHLIDIYNYEVTIKEGTDFSILPSINSTVLVSAQINQCKIKYDIGLQLIEYYDSQIGVTVEDCVLDIFISPSDYYKDSFFRI